MGRKSWGGREPPFFVYEPYFVGKDVCDCLDIGTDQTRRLDGDEKGVAKCDTLGGEQEVTIINESGLYSLVFSSHLPQAKAFKRHCQVCRRRLNLNFS